ncbi:MAG: hypothetical protein AAF716_20495 [Cyanobacteria bacterium P01_D01_bin.1]
MTALSTANSNTLHTQHTLQSKDILLICQLASATDTAEDTLEQIQSWSFEQFFGFTCHLFVTTESSTVRQQLAELFPKFGKIAILSLVKIVYFFDLQRDQVSLAPRFPTEVQHLAITALENMSAHSLAVGIAQVIEEDTHGTLRSTVVSLIARAFYKSEEDILSLLSHHLSKDSWYAIETSLIDELSSPQPQEASQKIFEGNFNNVCLLQSRSQIAERQLTEVA